MNTLECIDRRTSVRSYLDKPVETEKLATIAEAGLKAPTAMNSRDIILTVARGSLIDKLVAAMRRAMDPETAERFMKDGKFDFHRGAPALIVVAFGGKSVLPEQNTGCVMENMYLAATELGLGSCWINQFYAFGSEEIRSLLRLPSGYRPFAALAVGYTDVMPPSKSHDEKIVFLDE